MPAASSPSNRLDTQGVYSFVGALEISSGGYLYRGSGVALSPNWLLSAGLVDDGLSINVW